MDVKPAYEQYGRRKYMMKLVNYISYIFSNNLQMKKQIYMKSLWRIFKLILGKINKNNQYKDLNIILSDSIKYFNNLWIKCYPNVTLMQILKMYIGFNIQEIKDRF